MRQCSDLLLNRDDRQCALGWLPANSRCKRCRTQKTIAGRDALQGQTPFSACDNSKKKIKLRQFLHQKLIIEFHLDPIFVFRYEDFMLQKMTKQHFLSSIC
jgi:hypothetical protein